MGSIMKIHFSNSTGVSLNDRFTIMAKIGDPPAAAAAVGTGPGVRVVPVPNRPRPRSNSLSRSDTNRQLISQWDRSHAVQSAALALKNTSTIRSGRQRLQRNNMQSQQLKRTLGALPGGFGRLQRSNSFGNIATMNADRVELQQKFRSKANAVASRLGQTRAMETGAIQRGRSRTRRTSSARSASRPRSASRTRSASRNRQYSSGLRRSGSNANLSGSRNGLNTIRNEGAPVRRRLNRTKLTLAERIGVRNGAVATTTRGRSRSRSRLRTTPASVAAATAAAASNGRARPRKRAGSRMKSRTGSVNSRLGANRTNEPTAISRVDGGRVAKRSTSRRRRGGQGATVVAGTRPGRSVKRGAAVTAATGRGTPKNGAQNSAQNGGPGAGKRGRSRSRSRAVNSRTRARNVVKKRTQAPKQQKEVKSREELDNELDQYMANTKSCLDKEMDEYMNGIGGRH
ncbi:uncharacterized protein LOC128271460 [Anopheles cruzii]|uniref:uncharacterized protein LOC128271460 n=1 Tax=Anopheles cruzii TaxID=68878 RepID=UPI0022EC46CB|nr:uncharacterized protein LOC128271460 [Anopheles cruzii]